MGTIPKDLGYFQLVLVLGFGGGAGKSVERFVGAIIDIIFFFNTQYFHHGKKLNK